MMYKFRSMKLNAEEELKKLHAINEAKGPLFKIKEDLVLLSLQVYKTSMMNFLSF